MQRSKSGQVAKSMQESSISDSGAMESGWMLSLMTICLHAKVD